MIPWIAALVAALAIVLLRVGRRRRAHRHASLREDLFEGLLPSAVTGAGDRPPASDGWGLRWTEVTNLTAGDLAGPPRRRTRADAPSEASPPAGNGADPAEYANAGLSRGAPEKADPPATP